MLVEGHSEVGARLDVGEAEVGGELEDGLLGVWKVVGGFGDGFDLSEGAEVVGTIEGDVDGAAVAMEVVEGSELGDRSQDGAKAEAVEETEEVGLVVEAGAADGDFDFLAGFGGALVARALVGEEEVVGFLTEAERLARLGEVAAGVGQVEVLLGDGGWRGGTEGGEPGFEVGRILNAELDFDLVAHRGTSFRLEC
jgi:hypothetical protein